MTKQKSGTTISLGRIGRLTLTRPDRTDTLPDDTADEPQPEGTEPEAPEDATPEDSAPEDTDAATTDEPETGTPDDDSTADHPPRRRLRVAVAAVAAIVAVAMLVTGIILAIDNGHRDDIRSASGPLTSTVAGTVVSMLSYDHKTVADDLAKADPGLTKEFREEYTKLTKDTIVSAAQEKKVITKVTVVGNSIIEQSAGNAKLLLFLNQMTTTAANPDPTTTGSRVEVQAVRSGDRWLVDSLRPV